MYETRAAGSSPRVRGTPSAAAMIVPSARFIPACAGNAPTARTGTSARSVHPRVCGERVRGSPIGQQHGGSSPRVRGTRSPGSICWANMRFIPACAGNAFSAAWKTVRAAVHPRVCGERFRLAKWQAQDIGSSPRVRGTRFLVHEFFLKPRFIPACAGNAWALAPRNRTMPVHPRVCGERFGDAEPVSGGSGSSPRVRGTPNRFAASPAPARFIPACAGNANSVMPRWNTLTVHPRVCGERPLHPPDQKR